LGSLSQIGALPRPQEPEHPYALEEVGVAMLFFELLQLLGIFPDYLWIVDLWHVLIMPPINRNGIMFDTLQLQYDILARWFYRNNF